MLEKIDKYGRKVSKSQGKGDLLRLYKLKNEEESAPRALDYARGEGLIESSDEDEERIDLPQRLDSPAGSSEDDDDNKPVRLGRDPSSSSKLNKKSKSQAESDEDIPLDIDLDETNFEDLDAQAAAYAKKYNDENSEASSSSPTGKETSRLAVVYLDWDHVRASHLFKIFNSVFTSKSGPSIQKRGGGRVLSVRIYPSQFGKERMAKEEVEGPPAELFRADGAVADEDMDEEDVNEETIFQTGDDSNVNNEALRKYPLNRTLQRRSSICIEQGTSDDTQNGS